LSRTLILGGSGCLGSSITAEMKRLGSHVISTTQRIAQKKDSHFEVFRIGDEITSFLEEHQVNLVINCIGARPQRVLALKNTAQLFRVNSYFPRNLMAKASRVGVRVIHISTDGVFSGRVEGGYSESAKPWPMNSYSLSKFIGEPNHELGNTIRLSFVPANFQRAVLYKQVRWIIDSSQDVKSFGYTNIYWNGLTDQIAGRLIAGIANSSNLLDNLPKTTHLYSSEVISKYDLSLKLLKHYGIPTNQIHPMSKTISRRQTLSSVYPDLLSRIWKTIGFDYIPSISELLEEKS
jgi:dTDP-4-dehydrorhamnose reductase